MKYIFSLLLFLLIFGNILTSLVPNNKTAMNILNEPKTDIISIEQTTIIESSIIEEWDWEDFINSTIDYEAFNGSGLFDEPVVIFPELPVATKPKNLDYSDASIQFKKFHNYHNYKIYKRKRIIDFNLFLYFLNRAVAQIVIFRVRIIYQNKPINSQEEPEIVAQSTPSICIITDGYKDKIGKNETEVNIEYNCLTTMDFPKSEVLNITLNTDINLYIDGETVDFYDINFDIDAAEESINIADSPIYKKAGILDNAQVELPIQRNYFRINGTLIPEDLLSQSVVIPMEFIDYEQGNIMINCTAIKVNKPNCTLECNTENQAIKCMNNDFTAAKSLDPKYFIKINMNQELMNIETPIPIKSSSGLSKGAIAGIVIACVVVVAAISIVIIKCRKKPPPNISQNDNPKNLNQTEILNFKPNKMKTHDPKKVDAKIYDPKKIDTKINDPKIKPNDEKIYNGIDKKFK